MPGIFVVLILLRVPDTRRSVSADVQDPALGPRLDLLEARACRRSSIARWR